MRSEEGLGWRLLPVLKETVAKKLREEPNFAVVALRSGEKKYCLTQVPLLSETERLLLHNMVVGFQLLAGKKAVPKPPMVFFREFLEQERIELEPEQEQYLRTLFESQVSGFGPLDGLLQNDALEEIAITGIGAEKPVRVFHPAFGWLETNLFFSDPVTVKNLVNKMARSLGRRLSLQTPRLNALLEDGSRIHAVMEPVAFSGIAVTIRKFRSNPFSPLDLVRSGVLNESLAAFLWLALESDSTVLLCGNTGSGKTSSLNALFLFVPASERIIVAEETPEMRLPHLHQIRLSTAAEAGIDMHSLIIDSLRMRPDRMIVGEIRTANEAKAFLDTLLAGQGKGSYATFHSQSVSEAVQRLKSMGLEERDLASIDLVLVQKRWTQVLENGFRREARKIIAVAELEWLQNRLVPRVLAEWDFEREQWVWKEKSTVVWDKVRRTFGCTAEKVPVLQKQKERLLKQWKGRVSDWNGFFAAVNTR